MRLTALIPTLALIGFLLPTPAAAQPKCDMRDRVLTHLATQYDEAPVSAGVTNRGTLLEVLSTADGSTWTIVVTMPDGVACLVAAGEGWRTKEPQPTGSES